MDEQKYSQLYQALLQEVLQFHIGNQRRVRKGMLSLLLVPLVFLVLLFLSDGSRVIFLLLWIVSMFGIAAYLIAVEYVDYQMQNKVKKITKKEVELDQLTALPAGMPPILPMLRGREPEAAPAEDEDLEKLLSRLQGGAPADPVSAPAGAVSAPAGAAQPVPGPQPEPQPQPVPEPQPAPQLEPEPAPEPRPASRPAPAASQAALSADLAQTLSTLQAGTEQLAQGLAQLSQELGRISRYMEDQESRTKEVQQ